ncbi:NAD(P)/FAD-dependent oxidoreductase [Rhizohabitans arisaemae]|uniref:NAD(P)/FAD-dependent oxidoreductase n=1 Tax=Rhizohabitans arisaemae TaxID=2720610 RepID=UPI0024B15143|nr:FAD-dependent oxidoreductase [Rhizohabitans arisaemae]
MEHVVVVGAGLAGLRSVESLRAQGYTGRLTLVGEEPHRTYDRPPLSKAVLGGALDDTTVDSDWAGLDVDLRLGVRATALTEGVVVTDAGEIGYDGLVIATGAAPVRLPGEGRQYVLRTIEDALELRSRFGAGVRVTVIGAGWIGAEVATAAAAAGCRTTVVEADAAPLASALGTEIGARTVPWYREAGVELRLGVKVAEVAPEGVVLVGEGLLEADVVVTGIGVRPCVGWLAGSGIAVEDGVVVDGRLAASLPSVVAVGDCASWWSARYGRRLRIEHWDTALSAPEVAAGTLLGGEAVYDPVPYFWSEQFGRMVQFAGYVGGARLVWRGDPGADRAWAACWVTEQGRLAAVLTVDRPRDLVQGRRIIGAGQQVDERLLADPRAALRDAVLR